MARETKLFDRLFNDRVSFILFFINSNSAEHRSMLLTTDKLKYWYCRHIDHECHLGAEITEPMYSFLYCYYVKELKSLVDHMGPPYGRWYEVHLFNKEIARSGWSGPVYHSDILAYSNGKLPGVGDVSLPVPITSFIGKSGDFVTVTDECALAEEEY